MTTAEMTLVKAARAAEGTFQLCYENTSFLYDPFPIGLSKGVLPAQTYQELVETWPANELFQYKEKLGHKYSLSEVNNPDNYHTFLQSSPVWLRFYRHVKSQAFVGEVLDLLCKHHIDLGLHNRHVSCLHRFSGWKDKLDALPGKIRRLLARGDSSLSVRFEFSMLPADRGCIKPHTDAPQKLITLVLSMMAEGEWDQAHGGGTAMMRPKDMSRNFNLLNKQFEFEQMETIQTFPFEPNQCLLFVKTFNSWHAVAPMTGNNSKTMRKTLTINIETWG